jgi:hypothetical protein
MILQKYPKKATWTPELSQKAEKCSLLGKTTLAPAVHDLRVGTHIGLYSP